MRSVAEIFRAYGVLDDQGRHVNGTDKMTCHNYGDAYEDILLGMRSTARLVMEVGIADDSSLLAWGEVFPNALCVGLDIHPAAYISTDNSRFEFHLGDQRSFYDCQRAAKGRQFDFICEDATHQLADSLLTLLYLWPYVRPGGTYVIEEFAVGCANADILLNSAFDLWPQAEIVNTQGPFGNIEPLVVLRKPS